jgi:amidase
VALATGMTPLGLGTDIGGSLRCPAFCCGVASLKPGFGRVPNASFPPPALRMPTAQFMAGVGPMARTIDDVALAFELLAGPHPSDPFTFPRPAPFGDEQRPLRVAVMAELPGPPTHPDVVAAVRLAADCLRQAGHVVQETAAPQFEDVVEVWRAWLLGEMALILGEIGPLMSPDARRYVELTGQNWDASAEPLAFGLLSRRHGLARAWSEFFADYDVVVCPVWTQPPFEVGADVDGIEGNRRVGELMRPAAPGNLLGLPAATVPVGLTDGLPMGVQVIADRFREDRCLRAAQAIEDVCDTITPIEPRAQRAPAARAATSTPSR